VTSPFPVADTAEAALHAPLGEAAREREAQAAAQGRVRFVTEWVGPAFTSREAAASAYAGKADAPWCALRPVAAEGRKPQTPARPAHRDGARWPAPAGAADATRWRLSVTYWKRQGEAGEADALELEAARRLRRDEAGGTLDARALRRLTAQPLRPVRPQQPLDIGLFEARLPERPDVVVPDE
jgi:hypothetical protein